MTDTVHAPGAGGGSVPQDLRVVTLATDVDVFAVRQLGRDLATAAGLDRLDVTRMATALSELAREAVTAGGGRLTFSHRDGTELVAAVSAEGLTPHALSVRAAHRLVDSVVHAVVAGRLEVRLTMHLPSVLTTAERDRVAGVFAAHAPTSPMEELRQQNSELLGVLEEVRTKNVELQTMNVELEETNRGVVALYTELSGELERTNQGVVALYAEIDEKNQRLTAASEAKSRFLRNISHELRTPVNSVLGLTRLMTHPGAGPLTMEQSEQVEFIRASATDLATLVNELLDLAKAESGRLDPTFRDVDVGTLCRELRGLTSPLLRGGVQLLVEPGPAGSVLRTDPELLRHVLRNLLSNAAKFTVAGTVELTFQAHADTDTFTVSDTGVGMSEADQALVFEEFYQARTPLHASTRGTGLGLPFAAAAAEALGAEIEVRSRLGEGSAFVLRLPRRPSGPTAVGGAP